jgi:hypothetical protein
VSSFGDVLEVSGDGEMVNEVQGGAAISSV